MHLNTQIFNIEKVKQQSLIILIIQLIFTVFYIHFLFLTVHQESYSEKVSLASFYIAVMGVLTMFTTILKPLVYNKLMKSNLKIRICFSLLINQYNIR